MFGLIDVAGSICIADFTVSYAYRPAIIQDRRRVAAQLLLVPQATAKRSALNDGLRRWCFPNRMKLREISQPFRLKGAVGRIGGQVCRRAAAMSESWSGVAQPQPGERPQEDGLVFHALHARRKHGAQTR